MKKLFDDEKLMQRPLVIAGPCSAESEEQMLTTARGVAAAGVKIFRAGVWKPRTKPGGFEGIGAPALAWLARVKEETGLLTATEVATGRHLDQALEAGVDVLWIGARTSANPFAVQEIADGLAKYPADIRQNIVVLIKNPVNPDLELWIGAIERIRRAGIERIGAIHRGFSAYGKQLYRNPPQWRIPIELQRRMPGLPLLCDPSHIAGRRDLIDSLAQQALDLRFDGLIIESHCNPEVALSDKHQQLTPERLDEVLRGLVLRSSSATDATLDQLRSKIDRIDGDIIELLAERMTVAREIGLFKRDNGMPVVQPHRYNNLMHRQVENGIALGLNEDFVHGILAAIHEESVRSQLNVIRNQSEDKN